MARERRVLLVEDDAATAEFYVEQLRHDGVPIEHVCTGSAAEQFMRVRRPVLVLMDLTLPDVDGRDLAERWAEDPMLGHIPVWIVSNADAQDNLWWHNAPNVQRYFLKSRVALGRLSAEIRATLGLPYGDRLQNREAAS
ncbi:MAG TPA: response regulator [Candidatus Limnocylindrales bacterium]|nr:response regulator [Candidatus Limnocylindrales bacterium]